MKANCIICGKEFEPIIKHWNPPRKTCSEEFRI